MEHGKPLGLWFISVTLTISNAYAFIRSDIKYGIDIVENRITMVRFSR